MQCRAMREECASAMSSASILLESVTVDLPA
jgi:hypothetical protein